MAVLGLILLLLGVGAAAFSIWATSAGESVPTADGGTALSVPLFGGNGFQLEPMTLVILGVGGALLALLGLWLMVAAGKRSARRARERRDLRKTQKQQEKELAETRSRLAAAEGQSAATAARPVHETRDQHVVREEATYTTDESDRRLDDPRDGTLR